MNFHGVSSVVGDNSLPTLFGSGAQHEVRPNPLLICPVTDREAHGS